jgi:hypothetical protein
VEQGAGGDAIIEHMFDDLEAEYKGSQSRVSWESVKALDVTRDPDQREGSIDLVVHCDMARCLPDDQVRRDVRGLARVVAWRDGAPPLPRRSRYDLRPAWTTPRSALDCSPVPSRPP